MSALTKRRPTETVEVTIGGAQGQRFVGPREKVKPILRLLGQGGFTPLRHEDTVPWRTAFKSEIEQYGEPAMTLRGVRLREGLTQAVLAKKLGIAHYNLSKMENGYRPISKKMALRLAKVLRTDYHLFL